MNLRLARSASAASLAILLASCPASQVSAASPDAAAVELQRLVDRAVAAALGWTEWRYFAFALFATALVEYKHIPNIQRLRSGTEPKIGQGGNRPATG